MPVYSAERVSIPEEIAYCMAKSTQERHHIYVANVGKASLREGVWLCTSEAAHKDSPFDHILQQEFSLLINYKIF